MLAALRIVLIKFFDCAVGHLDRDVMRAEGYLRQTPGGFPPVCVLAAGFPPVLNTGWNLQTACAFLVSAPFEQTACYVNVSALLSR